MALVFGAVETARRALTPSGQHLRPVATSFVTIVGLVVPSVRSVPSFLAECPFLVRATNN